MTSKTVLVNRLMPTGGKAEGKCHMAGLISTFHQLLGKGHGRRS